MYYRVNILLTKNVLEHVHLEDAFVQNQLPIAGQQDSISFSNIPVASQCISLLKPSVYWLQWGWFEQFFQCFETRRSLDT